VTGFIDHRRYLYRALRVPEVLADKAQLAAAAVRLYELTYGERPQPSEMASNDNVKARLEDSQLVVEAVVAALVAGDLDPLLGGFGLREVDAEADRLVNRLDAHSGQTVVTVSRVLVRLLIEYVAAYPFID